MKDTKALQFALAKFATNLCLVVNLIVHFEQEEQLKIVVFTQEDFVNTKIPQCLTNKLFIWEAPLSSN